MTQMLVVIVLYKLALVVWTDWADKAASRPNRVSCIGLEYIIRASWLQQIAGELPMQH